MDSLLEITKDVFWAAVILFYWAWLYRILRKLDRSGEELEQTRQEIQVRVLSDAEFDAVWRPKIRCVPEEKQPCDEDT